MRDNPKFKDSGARQKFSTGAHRDVQVGKGRFDLLPFICLFLVSRIYEDGAIKYEHRNWEKGIPVSRFIDSAQRHLAKFVVGLRDEPHLPMAIWNLMCALWTCVMVSLCLKPANLFDLPNHIGKKPVKPLGPYEEEALKTFLGRKI